MYIKKWKISFIEIYNKINSVQQVLIMINSLNNKTNKRDQTQLNPVHGNRCQGIQICENNSF